MQRLMLLLSIAILAVLLIYSDFFKVLQILASSDLRFVAIGFLLWCLGVAVRSLRWQQLLKVSGVKLSLKDAVHVYVPSLFFSNISPAKIGDALRPVLLKGMKKKSIAQSLPSVFVERLLDVAVLIFFSLLGLLFFGRLMTGYIILSVFIYLVAFSLGIWILVSERRTKFLLRKTIFLFKRIKAVKKLSSRLSSFSRMLSSSFLAYKSVKKLLPGLVLTFLVWFIEGAILLVAFKTIGLSVDYFVCLFTLSISVLLAVITFLPGGLGVNEAVTLLIFSTLYRLTPAQIMAGMILSRLYGYWLYVFIGAAIASASKYKL